MQVNRLIPRADQAVLPAVLLASILVGSALAILTHTPDDRERQESAYHLLTRFFDADQARQAALEAANATPGESLIYSTLSGNFESNIAGVSLPAHPEGGFVVRGPGRSGVVWRSPKLPVRADAVYRAVFDLTPLSDVQMTIQVTTVDGQEMASAPVTSATRSLAIAINGSAEPAYAAVTITAPVDGDDIVWIREFRLVEVDQ